MTMPAPVATPMADLQDLQSLFNSRFERRGEIYATTDVSGYWSNIDRDAQSDLLAALERGPFQQVVAEKLGGLGRFVLSPVRSAGLKLLDIPPDAVGIDYGCMWGNLLISAARQCRAMVGVDKTVEHLQFLTHRMKAESVGNILLLNADLQKPLLIEDTFDFAIINGVLEWVPDDREIAISHAFSAKRARLVRPRVNPRNSQLDLLRTAQRNLKSGGRLYLAIENRFDYQYFLWKKDPHANLLFASWLPRGAANLASNLIYGRPYLNYLYSAGGLTRLLRESGFDRVDRYVAFPNYRHPEIIMPLGARDRSSFRPIYAERPTGNPVKKAFRRLRAGMDRLVYQHAGLLRLAPAFIFVAHKR